MTPASGSTGAPPAEEEIQGEQLVLSQQCYRTPGVGKLIFLSIALRDMNYAIQATATPWDQDDIFNWG